MVKRLKIWPVLLLLLLVPLIVHADTVSGDWQYTLNDEGRAVITDYLGAAREVKMPWNVDGHIIAEIGEGAFADDIALRSIQLPVGVTIIRMEAFRGCTALQEVSLPPLLETIEDGAFAGCTALTLVEIPDSVAELGEAVFDARTALSGSGDSLAPGYARACGLLYLDSALLNEEDVPDDDDKYQYDIVNGYARITSYIGEEYEVVVPAELGGYPVRVIGTNAFSSRYEVEKVVLPEGLTELERTAFRKCPALRAIELPGTLRYIRDNAFYQCENLEEITIPASVVELGDRAFTGCSQLKRVTIYAPLQSMRTYTFFECHSTLTIYAPKGSVAERHAHSRGYRFVAID